MHTRTIVDFFMRKKQMKLQWKSSPCPKRQSWINHYDTTEMLNCLAQCSNSEHDKRGFWGAWSWETSGSSGSSGSIRAWSDRGSPIHYLVLTLCVSVDMRHWHIGAATVSRGLVALGGDGGGGGLVVSVSMETAWPWFTVTAPPGMWGQQARRARLLPLIFICSTVCFAFQSLAEREALDTPWMAQEPVHILKT